VNVICAFILFDPHHHHDNEVHDHTHRGAYVHILTDAMTSVFAIVGLMMGKHMGWVWADPAMGIVGSIVILKWSWGLIRQSAADLLDATSKAVNEAELMNLFSDLKDVTVTDVHVWKLAP